MASEQELPPLEPKFSMSEIFLGFLFALLIDCIAIAADLVSGGILGFVGQTLSWLLFSFWFKIKGATIAGDPLKGYLLPIITQAIPIIPTTAATFLVRVYIENHPEKFSIINKGVPTKSAGLPKK